MKTKIKILYIETTQGTGGAGVCLSHLIAQLNDNRFIPVILPTNLGSAIKKIQQNGYNVLDERLSFLKWKLWHPFNHIDFPIPLLGNLLKKLGILVSVLFFSFAVVTDYFTILIICKKNNIQIVHFNSYSKFHKPIFLVLKFLKIPVISHIRGAVTLGPIDRFFCRYCDMFISVSNFALQHMFGNKQYDYNSTVIYDGIDVKSFTEAADDKPTELLGKYDLNVGTKIVCMLSTLTEGKGHKCFLKAAAIVKRKFPSVKFLIVGGNMKYGADIESELIELRDELNLKNEVLMYGHCDEVGRLLAQVDISVQASELPEALGTAIIESMVCSKPVIASKVGATSELIEDGVNGFLYPAGDFKELSRKICLLLEDDFLSIEMGKAGYQKACDFFDISKIARDIENVYESVLLKTRL